MMYAIDPVMNRNMPVRHRSKPVTPVIPAKAGTQSLSMTGVQWVRLLDPGLRRDDEGLATPAQAGVQSTASGFRPSPE